MWNYLKNENVFLSKSKQRSYLIALINAEKFSLEFELWEILSFSHDLLSFLLHLSILKYSLPYIMTGLGLWKL